ncbi:MBL fold metallo-hydrolase [Hyphococcus luteus]|nr:MBL fold metallo-hydrolase [Marinicaulis flavus]
MNQRIRTSARPIHFLIAAAIPAVLLQPAAAQDAVDYLVRSTISDCANVRAGPDVESERLDCLSPGTRVRVKDSVPYWREIEFGAGNEGWIAKKLIEIAEPPSEPQEEERWLEIHFIDVGQGDAIWISTPDDDIDGNGVYEGRNIVIDGGPDSSDDRNAALSYMETRAHHMAVIDALIVTHPHTDHYRGAESLSRHFEIAHYYDPGYPSEAVGYNAFLDAMTGDNNEPARAASLHIGENAFGDPDWGGELDAEFLYSWKDGAADMGSGNTEVNNSSIVLKLSYGEHSFLFMGDAEGKDRDDAPAPSKYVEKRLVETQPDKLKSTLLKIGHHGSETSSTTAFIEAVDPEIVIVQSGRKPFNHRFLPDETALCRYCAHNPEVEIYRTDENDEAQGLTSTNDADNDHIVIRSNGTRLEAIPLSSGAPVDRNFCSLHC